MKVLGWMTTLLGNAARHTAQVLVPCTPERALGVHGEVLDGLGMMGDASLCLRCGHESYCDFVDPFIGCESRRNVVAPDDWPAIEKARRLPHGLEGEDDDDGREAAG